MFRKLEAGRSIEACPFQLDCRWPIISWSHDQSICGSNRILHCKVVNQTPSSWIPRAGPFLVHRSDVLMNAAQLEKHPSCCAFQAINVQSLAI